MHAQFDQLIRIKKDDLEEEEEGKKSFSTFEKYTKAKRERDREKIGLEICMISVLDLY